MSERDFPAVLAQIKPGAQRLIAQYPEPRSALLPILHLFQGVEGWVSPEALAATAELLNLPRSVVESTASFYTLFFRRPVGKYMLQPCRGIACIVRGADEIMAYFREQLGIAHLETTDDGLFSYEEVECLAACDRASCMQVNLEFVYDLTKEKIDALLAELRAGSSAIAPLPQSAAPARTWHVGYDPVRSPGAQGVDPDSPGGIGDLTGLEMLERLARDPSPIEQRPSKERVVIDGDGRVGKATA